jgi:hypothetical protein
VLYRCGNCDALLGPPLGATPAPDAAAAVAAADAAVTAPIRRRQPLVGLGTAAAVAIWLATGTFVLALLPVVLVTATHEDIESSVVAVGILVAGLMAFVAWLLFIAWLFLARRNVDTFPEAMPRWGLGWTVAAWFIPVAGVLIGPSVVADVAYNSADDFGVVERRRLEGAVWRWWTLYLIVTGVLATVAIWPRQSGGLFVVPIADTGLWVSSGLVLALIAIGCAVTAAAAISRVIVGVSSATARRDERAAVAGHPWSTFGM